VFVDRLRADALFGARGAVIGSAGEVVEACASTMEVARERVRDGAPDGYVVAAEYQSAGRGREGAWTCPSGKGLLMSIVLRLRLPARERKILTILGAVAAAEAVRAFGVHARIKWPNDVVIAAYRRGALRVGKLGGVLVEAERQGDAAPAHVLGIGINVNLAASDLPSGAAVPPTSMLLVAGRRFNRAALGRTLLAELDAWYRRLAMGQSEALLARWRRRSCLVGHLVRARVGRRVLAGTAVGIRSSGELILQDERGERLLLSDRDTRLLLY
jgi:BirA family biotin operon repressor/biotin-[acetyl-CoA-carboxylase] ligase